LPNISLILCGSPCQGFSFAGNQLAFGDKRSALFFEFIRILKECKPKYFLLENVRMKQEYIDIITDQVSECYPEEGHSGQSSFFDSDKRIEPVLINSSLVSAQNRQRLYWTNIPNVTQPEDRGIALRDVLEDTVAEHYQAGKELQQNYKGGDFLNPNYKSQANTIHDIDGKSGTICAGTHGYANGYVSTPRQVGTAIDINGHDILKRVYSPDGKSPTLNTMGGGNRQPKVVTGAWRGRYKVDGVRQDHKGSVAGRTKQMLELRKDDKTNALTTVQKDNVVVEPEKMNWRKLSVVECERLQTVDDNYTEGVSNTQRYKMLGNGFTVEIISHILSNVSPGQQQKKVDS
jgi:DNA (cytosine-5)-methyltransferase 3A